MPEPKSSEFEEHSESIRTEEWRILHRSVREKVRIPKKRETGDIF